MIRVLSFLSILAVASFSVAGQNQYIIHGEMPSNDFVNKVIYLTIEDRYSDKRYTKNDSCLIVNKSFTFKGEINKPNESAKLYFKKTTHFVHFSLDSGINKIKIDLIPKGSPTYKNKLSNTKFAKSESNNLLKKTDSLVVKYYTSFGKPAKKNSGVIQLSTERLKELKIKQLNILKDFQHTYYSLIALYKLLPGMLYDIKSVEETFSALDTALKSSPLGIELNEKIQSVKLGLIDQAVPDFSLVSAEGLLISSKEMIGKPYLLAFGATWCLPCKENYTMLQSLYKKYKDKGFEIIDVNLDADSARWRAEIEKYSLKWINISELKTWDESEMVKKFNIRAIPLYLIVDRSGKIIYHTFQLLDSNHKLLDQYIKKTLMTQISKPTLPR